ncbi:MAG: family transporter protein [Chthonomonadaceae bacterium]|nr:family transporter protein [Chthonomonadaceae bacterium]
MQFMSIARKDLRVLFRDRSALIFIFGLPIIMTSIFGVIFGRQGGKEEIRVPLKILVANLDKGPHGAELIASMQKLGMTPDPEPKGAAEVEKRVKSGDRPFGLTIPANFSAGLEAAVKELAANNPNASQVKLTLWVDPAQTQLEGLAQGTVLAASQRVYAPILRTEALARVPAGYRQFAEQNMAKGNLKPPIDLNVTSMPTETEPAVKPSPGDTLIPGFAVYFVFFMANGVASTLLTERQEGTLRRMLTTPVSRSQVLVGKLLARGVMGMIQTAILFLVGHFWLNLHLDSSPIGILVTALATIFCATGLGLLIATMGKTMEQIQGMTTMVLLLMGLLSGTLVPRQLLPESMQKLSLITPHAWALNAYQDMILRHKPLLATLPNIGVVLLFGVVFFGLALARFRFE